MKQMVDLIAVEHAVNRLINKRKREIYKENEIRIKKDAEIKKEELKALKEKAFDYKDVIEKFYSYNELKSNIVFNEPHSIDEILDLNVRDEYTYDEFVYKFEKVYEFYNNKVKDFQKFIIVFLSDNIIKLNDNKILSYEDINSVICYEEFCYIIGLFLKVDQSGNKEIVFRRRVNLTNYTPLLNPQPTSTTNSYNLDNIIINEAIIENMKNFIKNKLD